jgi:hypothetical protein
LIEATAFDGANLYIVGTFVIAIFVTLVFPTVFLSLFFKKGFAPLMFASMFSCLVLGQTGLACKGCRGFENRVAPTEEEPAWFLATLHKRVILFIALVFCAISIGIHGCCWDTVKTLARTLFNDAATCRSLHDIRGKFMEVPVERT